MSFNVTAAVISLADKSTICLLVMVTADVFPDISLLTVHLFEAQVASVPKQELFYLRARAACLAPAAIGVSCPGIYLKNGWQLVLLPGISEALTCTSHKYTYLVPILLGSMTWKSSERHRPGTCQQILNQSS